MLELKTVCPLHVLLAEGKARMFTVSIVVLIYGEAMIREA